MLRLSGCRPPKSFEAVACHRPFGVELVFSTCECKLMRLNHPQLATARKVHSQGTKASAYQGLMPCEGQSRLATRSIKFRTESAVSVSFRLCAAPDCTARFARGHLFSPWRAGSTARRYPRTRSHSLMAAALLRMSSLKMIRVLVF